MSNTLFDNGNSIESYEIQKFLGKGSYGVVSSAYDTQYDEEVAIKHIMNPFQRSFTTQLRLLSEIKILKHLDHENLIFLKEVIPPTSYSTFDDIYLVTELMDSDLSKVITNPLYDYQVEFFMYQLLCGINYLHSANIIHRDLKPSNILINDDNMLKICDFGMAVGIDRFCKTSYVATRWYRAPELILGSATPRLAVDMWSVGCIFAEMLNGGEVLFPGQDELGQIEEIINSLGLPKKEDVRGSLKGRHFISTHKPVTPKDFKTLFPDASNDAIDLISKLLEWNPDKRISAKDALSHPFFKNVRDEEMEYEAESIFKSAYEKHINKRNIKRALYNEIVPEDENNKDTNVPESRSRAESF